MTKMALCSGQAEVVLTNGPDQRLFYIVGLASFSFLYEAAGLSSSGKQEVGPNPAAPTAPPNPQPNRRNSYWAYKFE
jgi:hypothetical protein